jgi:hypothetical protein
MGNMNSRTGTREINLPHMWNYSEETGIVSDTWIENTTSKNLVYNGEGRKLI